MKKMKIFMSVLLAMLLAMASFSALAVYETQITFSDAVYYGENGTTVIAGPQNGTFYVQVTATYTGGEDRSANMMGALYDVATGEIKAIAISETPAVWPGEATQTLRIKMENVTNIDSYEFRCFMIDDLMRHTPLDNAAPAKPGAIVAGDVTVNSANLSWGAALDDFDNVEGYEVYKNGAKIGYTENLSITAGNLLRNSKNNFSVKAFDGELLSEETKITDVTVTEIPENILYFGDSFVHGNHFITEGNGLAAVMANSGSHEFRYGDEIGGRKCAKISAGKYPGFAAADHSYITEADANLVFEITYFDKASSSSLIYIYTQTIGNQANYAVPAVKNPLYHPVYNNGVDETVSEATNAGAPAIRNSGVWKTVAVEFTNASFTADGPTGQLGKNFYIRSSNSGDVFYLASGNLYKAEDYVPMNPNMVVANGGQTVHKMDFVTTGGYDVAYTIETVEGIDCVASTDSDNLKYKVTDIAVTGASDAVLEVTFYDDNEGDTLNVGSHEILMDGSGWRTVALDMTGSELGANFAIYKDSNTRVCIKDLQAYAK